MGMPNLEKQQAFRDRQKAVRDAAKITDAERTDLATKYGTTKEGRERMGSRVERLLADHPRYAAKFDRLLRRISRELKTKVGEATL